jgi:hypothetical protein
MSRDGLILLKKLQFALSKLRLYFGSYNKSYMQ